MRKFMVIAIPIVILVIFVLIMLSGDFLKKPLGKDDDIPKSIDGIIKNLQEDKWEEVDKETTALSDLWKRIVKRVQFSSERDEINSFSSSIARLRGAILAKDKANALIELKEAYNHWYELGR